MDPMLCRVATVVAGAVLTGSLGAVEMAGTRPNIVLMIADDMDWQSLGCMGDPNVRTPRLDALAAEGVVLTQMFTPSTVCAPCRTAMMTGLYGVHSGGIFNHPFCLVKPDTATLPQQLRQAGYRVAVLGKIDLGPIEAFPFELIPEAKDMRSIPLPEVRAFLTRDAQQPFCFVYGSGRPHGPWTGKRTKGATPTDPATLTLPPTLVDTPATRTALAAYYDCVGLLDSECGQIIDLVQECQLAASTLMVFNSEQGREIPWGKHDAVDDSMRSTTIVRWPGKVAPGTRNASLCATIDLMPTVLEAAGVTAPPRMDGRSLLPVLAGEVRHADAVYGYGGNGQRTVRTRDFALVRTYGYQKPIQTYINSPTGYHAVWWKEWQALAATEPAVASLIQRYEQRPFEEMHAVGSDRLDYPRLPNLVETGANPEVLAALRGRLDRWMADFGDTGLATEDEIRRVQLAMIKAGAKQYYYSSPREKAAK